MPTKKAYYRVEVESQGCRTCGHAAVYIIVGADEIADSTSYQDKEPADEACEVLNEAHDKGFAVATASAVSICDSALAELLEKYPLDHPACVAVDLVRARIRNSL